MEWFDNLVGYLNDLIWSPPLIIICLLSGVFYTIRLNFFQVRYLKQMVRLLYDNTASKNGISSFQALTLAISGRVGTGNIAGVATAITFGGPGAIFWMWVMAGLGSATAFVESVLAQVYKTEIDGQYRGGPVFYIRKGLKWKSYAVVFAVATIFANAFSLPGVQSKTISAAFYQAFELPPYITGICLTILAAIIITGGIHRISKFTQYAVPIMTITYVGVALIIIFINIKAIPEVFQLIFNSAFNSKAPFGGLLGATLMMGVKRGIFSNEAGQGSGAHAAAAADVSHPVKQGLVQAFGVYVDTFFVCSATAFIILLTGHYNIIDEATKAVIVENLPGVKQGPEYAQLAIESTFNGFGSSFLAIALFFFAFTSAVSYYYQAETNLVYLMTSSKWKKQSLFVLKLVFLFFVMFGSVAKVKTIWDLGDVGIGIMLWLNLLVIVLLHKVVVKCLKDYNSQLKAGTTLVFNPALHDIKNTDAWD